MTETLAQTLILGPYKEPLRKVKGGHGYIGALTFNVLGQVQCHICGGLFDALSSHIWKSHRMKTDKYREDYKLAPTTKLISERYREEKKNTHLRYLSTLTREERYAHRRRAQRAVKSATATRLAAIKKGTYVVNKSLEQANKRGICPDQLIDIIRRAHKHYGHTPSMDEFENLFTARYREPIKRTFGSWNRAIKKAGLSPRGVMRVKVGLNRLSDEELLDYLTVFWKENGRIPTASDCRRGFLPPYMSYHRHFGGFPAARRRAGVPDLAPNELHPHSMKAKGLVTGESSKLPQPLSLQ